MLTRRSRGAHRCHPEGAAKSSRSRSPNHAATEGSATHYGRATEEPSTPRQASPRRRTSCGRCSEFIRPNRPGPLATGHPHAPTGVAEVRASVPLPRPGWLVVQARSFGPPGFRGRAGTGRLGLWMTGIRVWVGLVRPAVWMTGIRVWVGLVRPAVWMTGIRVWAGLVRPAVWMTGIRVWVGLVRPAGCMTGIRVRAGLSRPGLKPKPAPLGGRFRGGRGCA